MMIEECHTHPTFGSILYRIGGKWWMKMSIRQRGFTLWTEGKNGGGLGMRLRQTYSHMGGDIYFVCLSDIGGKLIGKTCITAAVVIELVSPISLSSNSFPISNWVLQNNLWVRLLFVWTKSMKIFLKALFNGVKRIDILPMLSTDFERCTPKFTHPTFWHDYDMKLKLEDLAVWAICKLIS